MITVDFQIQTMTKYYSENLIINSNILIQIITKQIIFNNIHWFYDNSKKKLKPLLALGVIEVQFLDENQASRFD